MVDPKPAAITKCIIARPDPEGGDPDVELKDRHVHANVVRGGTVP
jgi:hypothetical protein